MLKKLFCLLFVVFALCLSVSGHIEARQKNFASGHEYCSTMDGYDYYVTSVDRPQNPLLYHVMVSRSDGAKLYYGFNYNPDSQTFSYNWNDGGTPGSRKAKHSGSGQVSDNQLANDILYVALKMLEE